MPGEGGVVTTLARLVEVLGRSVLEVRGAPGGLEIKLREPVVFDLADPPPIAAGNLVLGTGLGPDDAAELLPILAGRGAAALVVKAPVAGAVGEAAVRAGVALLAVPRGALWTQAVSLIQSVTGHQGGRDRPGAVPPGDLFATADAVATLIGGPVTIEDRQSRLPAYSGSQNSPRRSVSGRSPRPPRSSRCRSCGSGPRPTWSACPRPTW